MAVKPRRAAAAVDVAGVKVGGNHPVVVQSMTNTDTADITGTVNQAMAQIFLRQPDPSPTHPSCTGLAGIADRCTPRVCLP